MEIFDRISVYRFVSWPGKLAKFLAMLIMNASVRNGGGHAVLKAKILCAIGLRYMVGHDALCLCDSKSLCVGIAPLRAVSRRGREYDVLVAASLDHHFDFLVFCTGQNNCCGAEAYQAAKEND